MARDSCLTRVGAGVALGGAIGGAVEDVFSCCLNCKPNSKERKKWGAVFGTYDAIRCKVPGLLKVRHIGQTTIASAGIFGLFLGAGSLIHCGKSY